MVRGLLQNGNMLGRGLVQKYNRNHNISIHGHKLHDDVTVHAIEKTALKVQTSAKVYSTLVCECLEFLNILTTA